MCSRCATNFFQKTYINKSCGAQGYSVPQSRSFQASAMIAFDMAGRSRTTLNPDRSCRVVTSSVAQRESILEAKALPRHPRKPHNETDAQ
jgi:hypothetical protein